ncbi:MAG TPA: hypothetical protein VGW10_06510 [Solirubrobacteraceae bacterium]|nr:hypothetical protein [Solirubrobacteraceae bacterium]
MVAVETPFRDFLALWERAAGRPAPEQVALWEEHYVARHRSLFDHYLGWFAVGGTVEEALPRYPAVVGELEDRFAALEVERSAREVGELFGVDRDERAIAFVGVFSANAWMDAFEGEPTVFFALEADPARSWHRATAVHELAHLAHERARGSAWDDETPGLTLMQEGVAIAATRRLVPDAGEALHFTVDDFAAYEAACRPAWPDAARKLLACLDRPDARMLQRFFWPDWGREERDVPERIGYFAADRVVQALLDGRDLAELARWPQERVLAEVRATLETVAA